MPLGVRDVLLLIRARDQASRIVGDVSRAFTGLGGAANLTGAQMMQVGSALTGLGIGIAAVGAAGVAFLGSATKAAIEHNKEASLTLTQITETGVKLEDVKRIGIDVARAIPAPFKEMQGALYEIFSSTNANMGEARILLEAFAKGAVAGQVDVQTAGKATIGIMNAFKIPLTDVNRVMDVQFAIVRDGVITYQQFASTIGRSIPSAVKAGQSIEDLGGMIMFLTRNNLSAAMASTSAARALDLLANPVFAGRMEKIGISVYDANQNFRPMVDVVTDLRNRLATMTPKERVEELAALTKGAGGTIQAMRFLNLAVNDSSGLLQQMTDAARNSGGAFEEAYAIMEKTPAHKIQGLVNAWQIFKVEVGDVLLPIIGNIAEKIADLINKFANLDPKVKKAIVVFTAIASIALLVVGGFIAIVGSIMIFMGAIASLVGAAGIGAIIKTFMIFVGISTGVIAAMIAIGVAAYFIIKNWDKIKEKAKEVWDTVKKKFNEGKEAVKKFADDFMTGLRKITESEWGKDLIALVTDPIDTIKRLWNDFWGVLTGPDPDKTSAGLFGVFESAALRIREVWGTITGFFSGIWDSIKQGASDLWNTITTGVTNAWNSFMTFVTGLPGMIATGFQAALDWAVNFAAQLPYWIGFAIGAVLRFFWDLPGNIAGALAAAWQIFYDWAAELIAQAIVTGVEVFNNITDWFSKLPGRIEEFVTNAWNNFVTWGRNMLNTAQTTATNVINAIVNWFQQLPGRVTSFISSTWNSFTNWGRNMMNTAQQTGSSVISSIVNWFQQLPGRVTSFVSSTWSNFQGFVGRFFSTAQQIGSNVINGIVNFISSLPSRVYSIILNAINGVGSLGSYAWGVLRRIGSSMWEGFKAGLGISSPSFLERATTGIAANVLKDTRALKDNVDEVFGMAKQLMTTAPQINRTFASISTPDLTRRAMEEAKALVQQRIQAADMRVQDSLQKARDELHVHFHDDIPIDDKIEKVDFAKKTKGW